MTAPTSHATIQKSAAPSAAGPQADAHGGAPDAAKLVAFVLEQFELRRQIAAEYLPDRCEPLARTCRDMAERFLRGGRLLALGVGPYATDAQHISVEFVHPVIVGKRALPAVDLSAAPEVLDVLAGPNDIVMGFGPPEGDAALHERLERARRRGALVCAWPGRLGQFELPAATREPFVHQELTEFMYHTLWETVHVFFEHEGRAGDVGAASFLYPFLGETKPAGEATLADAMASIGLKASEDERLRAEFAAAGAEAIVAAAQAIGQRIAGGGTLLAFGNGGSATDANDLALDCTLPPEGLAPLSAISLSAEAANVTAISNDVGVELVFLRQLLALGRPGDAVLAISTSGKSKNICAALVEARKRGMLCVALFGGDGGDIVRQSLVDHALVVRCDYVPRIQEVQASIYHILRRVLAEVLKA